MRVGLVGAGWWEAGHGCRLLAFLDVARCMWTCTVHDRGVSSVAGQVMWRCRDRAGACWRRALRGETGLGGGRVLDGVGNEPVFLCFAGFVLRVVWYVLGRVVTGVSVHVRLGEVAHAVGLTMLLRVVTRPQQERSNVIRQEAAPLLPYLLRKASATCCNATPEPRS